KQALFRSIDGALQAATNTEIPASLLPRVRMQVALDSTKVNRRLPVLAFVTGGLVIGAIALSSSSLRHSAVSHSTAKEPAAPSIQSAVRQPTGLSVETSSIQVSPTPARPVARRERFILDRAAQRSEPEVLVSSEEEAGLRRYADLLRAKSFEAANRAAATDDAQLEIKPLEIAELGLRQLTIQPLEGSESD